MSIPDTLAASTSPPRDLHLRDRGEVPRGVAASAGVGLVARWSADPRPTASWNLERR